jgi:hypothetical protein
MSHPDPLYDPSDYLLAEYLYDNQEDDDMNYADDVDASNYDDYNDFHGSIEDWPGEGEDDTWDDSFDDSMDGDMESGLASAGWGTDEDYGYYGDDTPMSDDYYGGE